MLPYWSQSAQLHVQCVGTQARVLIPGLGRIAEYPLDGSRTPIQRDYEIFPAGDDNRIVTRPVSRRVVVKPVHSAADEPTWIVAARSHRTSNDLRHVPFLDYMPLLRPTSMIILSVSVVVPVVVSTSTSKPYLPGSMLWWKSSTPILL